MSYFLIFFLFVLFVSFSQCTLTKVRARGKNLMKKAKGLNLLKKILPCYIKPGYLTLQYFKKTFRLLVLFVMLYDSQFNGHDIVISVFSILNVRTTH